ncbi:hypothetical protein ACOMHN_054401 [Nucella lapillus]
MSAKEEAMAVIAVLTMAWAVLGTMGAVVKKSDDVQPLEPIVQELSSLQAQLTALQSALHQYKNGRIIIPGHNDADDHHIFAGGAITLQAGDEVTIRHHGTAGAVDGGPEAIFCGFTI